METEFCREIRQLLVEQFWPVLSHPRRLRIVGHHVVELTDHRVVAPKIVGVCGCDFQHFLRNAKQEENCVLSDCVPGNMIKIAKESLGVGMPAPPKVMGKVRQSAQPGRY